METDTYKVNEIDDKQMAVLYGGALGTAVIAVLELLSVPTLDNALTISLYAFAVSIPACCLIVLFLQVQEGKTHAATLWYSFPVALCALLGTLFGIAAVMFHFSNGAGILFSSLSCSWSNRLLSLY